MIVTIAYTAGSDRFAVTSPYEGRALMRSLPGGRWDPARKVWTFPTLNADLIKQLLSRAGVIYDEVGRKPGGGKPGPVPRQGGQPWAVALFAAVGPERADAVYRALSRVLHPDAGGSTELMAALNAARPKVGAR